MAIEFNDMNGNLDGHFRQEGYVCSCSNIGHTLKAEWCDDELDWGFTLTFFVSPFRPWYKRIWDAIKHVFFRIGTMQLDGVMLHNKDARKLHKFLGEYLETLDKQEPSPETK